MRAHNHQIMYIYWGDRGGALRSAEPQQVLFAMVLDHPNVAATWRPARPTLGIRCGV